MFPLSQFESLEYKFSINFAFPGWLNEMRNKSLNLQAVKTSPYLWLLSTELLYFVPLLMKTVPNTCPDEQNIRFNNILTSWTWLQKICDQFLEVQAISKKLWFPWCLLESVTCLNLSPIKVAQWILMAKSILPKLSMLTKSHPHKQIHHSSTNDEKRCYNYVISFPQNLYFW